MKLRPFAVLLALAFFYPFEDFLLKRLPVSDATYTYSRLLSEIVVYALFALWAIHSFRLRQRWRRTPADLPLVAFLLVVAATCIVNRPDPVNAFLNTKALLRYLAVFYLATQLPVTARQVRALLLAVPAIGVFQSLLAGYQHWWGLSEFWLPRGSDTEIAGYHKIFTALTFGTEKGAALGTLDHPVALGLYLLVACAILLAHWNLPPYGRTFDRFLPLALLALIAGGLLCTYSRASFLALVVLVGVSPLALGLRRRTLRTWVVLACFVLAIAFLFEQTQPTTRRAGWGRELVSPGQNLAMIFTQEYLAHSRHQRLWVLLDVGRAVLSSGTLIGYSPDERTARSRIHDLGGRDIQKVLVSPAFEDVYWVALLSYYGIIGLGLFVWLLLRLVRSLVYTASRTPDRELAVAAGAAASLILTNFALAFLVRTFEFRAFSYHLWLLAGIGVGEYLRLREEEHGVSPSTESP